MICSTHRRSLRRGSTSSSAFQSPNAFFMDVKCQGCINITTVFSRSQTVVCGNCQTMLCQPTGGKARLTEGCSFRRKGIIVPDTLVTYDREHEKIGSEKSIVKSYGGDFTHTLPSSLKIADFELANFLRPKNRQPLTSRVVTLWYHPPELLLGATDYGEAIDLWSVGCVFAEIFLGKPLFKGRTEVEQLHKIFKLCGTPPYKFWTLSKLPLANMFKPQNPYESTLHERCKEFPKSAVGLIQTFLSFEPYKRGNAISALESKYFNTLPYACDPTSLPKYPPNKEIDAKIRDDAKRKKSGSSVPAQSGSRMPKRIHKNQQEPSELYKVKRQARIRNID
ncbi:hypothetical protein CASFOL_033815 [Castilleja foliolosa]|uniref:Protein kinase domain-containing protein n=1 Tax=Castilleja foliolosa TaxID=1961234 RepID=A0ABD3BZA1_9LAMI